MKRSLCRALASVAPESEAGGTRVLMYHAIDDPDPSDSMALRVSQQRFLEQMTVLRDDDYDVVPLRAVLDARDGNGRTRVAITFDDGYGSQRWAATLLREFGFSATFFVVPRFLDGVREPRAYWETWGHLGWDDVGALRQEGFDIGAHSATHPDLRTCTESQLDAETGGARAVLERRLGSDVATFSYPYGRHDRRVRHAVERAGYQMACTSRYGVTRNVGQGSFTIHRTEITGRDDAWDFRAKLHGRYDWLGYWQDMRRAIRT